MPWVQASWLTPSWAEHDHDGQRMVQVVLFVCLALALLAKTVVSDKAVSAWPPCRRGNKSLVISVAMLVIAVVPLSVMGAQRPAWALLEVVVLGGMAMLAWTLAIAHPRQQQWIWAAALVGAGLFSVTTVLSTVGGMFQGVPPLVVDAIPGYSNIRHWNHVQVAAIPVMMGAVWQWRALRPVTWIGMVGVVSCVALLWTTGGRAASIALVGGAVLLGLLVGRKAKPLLFRWAFCLLFGVLLGMALLQWLPQLFGVSAERLLLARPITPSTESARLELWSRALDMAFSHPWVGVGPMHFANHPNPIATHPHNVYVQLAAEWGFPLALLVIWAVFYALWRMIHRLRQLPADHKALYPGMVLWWGCAAVMIDGLFSGNFVMPMSQVWIATLFGLTWAWWRSTAKPTTAVVGPLPVPICVGLALWCVLCTAALVWTTSMYIERETTYQRAPEAWQGHVLEQAPRFWTVGWFD